MNRDTTRFVRAGITLALLTALAWAGACSDVPGGPSLVGAGPDFQGLIVSDPVAAPGLTGLGGTAVALAQSAEDDVVYVSLAPGTVRSGIRAIVRRVGDADSLTTAVLDGGFDPVPIGAQVGDSIDVSVRDVAGGTVFQARLAVAARRPPIVVRTDPPRRKTDVPLNSAIVVVFSEPIDASTLTESSIQLRQDATSVAGRLEFRDAEHLRAAFVPDASLAASTDYQLVVTQGIRDLDGEPLEAPVTVDFTTTQPAAGLSIQKAAANSGDGQIDTILATLADPLRVLILRDGVAAAGVAVSWSTVPTEAGSVSASMAVTDSAGIASATWTLGPAEGAQTVQASAEGAAGSPLTFTADGVNPGAPASIQSLVFHNYVSVVSGTQGQLLVAAFDYRGNPAAPGVRIHWTVATGEGTVAAAQDTTVFGPLWQWPYSEASLTLGPNEGTTLVTATATQIPGAPSVTYTIHVVSAVVWIANDGFLADTVTVPMGSTVGWLMADYPTAHDVTFEDDSIPPTSSSILLNGEIHLRRFTNPGTYRYHCSFHFGSETGTVLVLPSVGPTAGLSIQKTAANSGDGQTDSILATLANPLRVLILRRDGGAAEGVAVSWSTVPTGAGSVSAAMAVTDSAGIASATWTLGTAEGVQTVEASAEGATGSPVTFTAVGANPGAPASIHSLVFHNYVSVVSGTQGQLLVAAFDRRGNPIDRRGNPITAPGVRIDWSIAAGEGTVAPAQDTTAFGPLWDSPYAEASLTLGPNEGTTRVTATATQIPGAPSVTYTIHVVSAVVWIANDGFLADTVTVPVGSTVGWLMADYPVAHDVTFEDDSIPPTSSPILLNGEIHLRRFTNPGTYRYHCSFHFGSETGTVMVLPSVGLGQPEQIDGGDEDDEDDDRRRGSRRR